MAFTDICKSFVDFKMDVADLKKDFIGFEMGFRIYQISLAHLDKNFNNLAWV